MPRSAKDIQLTELKDTILKLNELISAQTKSMVSLNKTIEELRQELSNKQAEVDYLKSKLFGSSSEKFKVPFPGQMNLFEEEPQDDRIPEIIEPEIIEPEIIEVTAHKRERKSKATYEEMFDNLPHRQVLLDTLTEEEKLCPVCGTEMFSIGTEIARTELAGYDTQQMCDTLPTVLNLAATGSIDLASASDMVTDAMSALGMGVSESEKMVDQMAKTASSTNTSVAQLGEGILTIGATAKSIK